MSEEEIAQTEAALTKTEKELAASKAQHLRAVWPRSKRAALRSAGPSRSCQPA